MKNLLLTMILALFTIEPRAQASIQEITTMSQILPYLNDETLLVFDLDNTVMKPVQTLGSDQWFKSLLSDGDTVRQAIRLWEQVQRLTKMQPVESITPHIIAEAQSRGLKVMALTARPSDLAQTTENQLSSIGVSFQNGIEYVGPTLSKGESLIALLNKLGFKPQRIVFIDDTLKHVQTVNASLDQAGIENFEFRYGAADSWVKAFNPTIVSIELQVFQLCSGKLISDSLALKINSSGSFECPH